jgi:hypothetical protein
MRFSHRHNKAAVAGMIVYAGCLAVAVAFFVENQMSRTAAQRVRQAEADAAALESRYTGTIVFSAGLGGRCRHLEFDNITGALRDSGASACRDEQPLGNSPQGRVNAIRDAFAKR